MLCSLSSKDRGAVIDNPHLGGTGEIVKRQRRKEYFKKKKNPNQRSKLNRAGRKHTFPPLVTTGTTCQKSKSKIKKIEWFNWKFKFHPRSYSLLRIIQDSLNKGRN